MAHPHSAGWSSGDWHRPIINIPFTGVPLAFSSFLFFIIFFLISVLLTFKFFFFSSFFLSFLSFLFFTLCLSSSTLYHLSMHVLAMSIESNFVFEFIAWVMVIMLVHSIGRKWIHVRPWLALRVVYESTTVSVVLHLKPFLSQVNLLLRFLTERPWDPLSSLEPLPVLIKVPKQEGLVMY